MADHIGGYLRTGRERTPVTGHAAFSGLVYADLADSVRSGTGSASFGVVWSRVGQGLGAIIELARHWQAGGVVMEPHPGVFCSNVRTEEWEPDPEVPGSEMHELVHADGVWAGLTRFTTVEGPSPWTPAQRETIHVLEGEVTIEIADGPALRLKPGDLASLPAGLETIWHITPPFTELWVLA